MFEMLSGKSYDVACYEAQELRITPVGAKTKV
jgi:hypothetical protein